ncbi:MAG: VOC family protein [bacterium]
MAVKAQPDGARAVTTTLAADNAAKLIDFLKTTFDARERSRMVAPDGKIAHAEVEIGDTPLMLSDTSPMAPPATATFYVYVEDCDRVFNKALASGATVVAPLDDRFYGDRSGSVRDMFGNVWTIATHVEDVSDEETKKRMQAMAPA